MTTHRPSRFPFLLMAVRLAIAAFLGAATTFIVAYALAIKYESVSFTGYSTDTLLQFTRQESPGLTVYEGTEFDRVRLETPDWRPQHAVLNEIQSTRFTLDTDEAFPLARTGIWPVSRPLFFIQSGWPARCFWGWDTFISSSTITGDGQGLAAIPQWLDDIFPTYLPLPHLPLWRGLIINTALFGSVWFGLLFIPGLIRRAHRRRRGRCLACGYDLHATPPGQPCPECGAVLGGRVSNPPVKQKIF